jgi:hypothetical protein
VGTNSYVAKFDASELAETIRRPQELLIHHTSALLRGRPPWKRVAPVIVHLGGQGAGYGSSRPIFKSSRLFCVKNIFLRFFWGN